MLCSKMQMLRRAPLSSAAVPRRAPAPTRSIVTRAGSKADELANAAASLFGKVESSVGDVGKLAGDLAAKAKQVDVQGLKDQVKNCWEPQCAWLGRAGGLVGRSN